MNLEISGMLYLDPFSGISGDMFIGALLDLGLDLTQLRSELAKLDISDYQLSSKRVMRDKLSSVKFDVAIEIKAHEHSSSETTHHHHAHEHRTFADIRQLIEHSALSNRVKIASLKVFQKLAEAEGLIHGKPPEQVAFHEVGALDSIVDIVGVCVGLEILQVDEVWCGPVALGSGGFVKCAHGLLPIPAPATLELMKGIPIRQTLVEQELTTPTGAALLAALVSRFCPLPAMTISRIGYGAGQREAQAVPNVLRGLLGVVETSVTQPATSDTLVSIQTNLDDTSPEILGYLMETLFAAGALDVFYTPIQMKKNRPATLLTVLAEPHQLNTLAGILFRESQTFGLRYQTSSRLKLSRRTVKVKTQYGEVRVKVGAWLGQETSIHPEYEDCRTRAQEHDVTLKDVIEAARAAYGNIVVSG
ncbi:MAG: nickel pincer cofactor biosynthesis protein LarC [Planctomycetota bacterium]